MRKSLENFMASSKSWSRGMILLGCVPLVGCGSSVLLDSEGNYGGVVRYHYNEHKGPMLSSHRGEALLQIREFCGGPYVIVREGPTRGRKRVVEGFGPSEVITEDWWGIQFSCQDPGG